MCDYAQLLLYVPFLTNTYRAKLIIIPMRYTSPRLLPNYMDVWLASIGRNCHYSLTGDDIWNLKMRSFNDTKRTPVVSFTGKCVK